MKRNGDRFPIFKLCSSERSTDTSFQTDSPSFFSVDSLVFRSFLPQINSTLLNTMVKLRETEEE